MVEQRIENPRVGGSIPPLATILVLELSYAFRSSREDGEKSHSIPISFCDAGTHAKDSADQLQTLDAGSLALDREQYTGIFA